MGFFDPDRGPRGCSASLGAVGRAAGAADRAQRGSRPGAERRWSPWPTRPTTATRCCRRWPTTRAPRCGCSRCSGNSVALGDHLRRHPEQWHELQDPTLGSTRPSASSMRAALLRAVGADPDAGPRRDRARAPRRPRTRCGSSTAGCCCGSPAATSRTTSGSTTPPPSSPTSPPAPSRRRWPWPAPRSGDAAPALPAGRDRDGQVRRPRAQLRQRRRRDLRGRAGGGCRRQRRRCGRPPSSPPTMMQVCSDHTGEGTIWPVDANLRPEGKSGPLVRTLASHRGYYERWAKTWEFQALLKARPVAGDVELGREYAELIGPMVWSASQRDGFVEEVQAMRRRVLEHIPADTAERQLKLGSGGLRDVEFAVQLLQLVHGRADEDGACADHVERARPAHRARVRRARGRSLAARRLRVPAHARAPDPALPDASYPRAARGRGVAAPARPLVRLHQRPGRRSWTSSGATTGARCAGCTRSSSTARCSPRSRGSAATRCG